MQDWPQLHFLYVIVLRRIYLDCESIKNAKLDLINWKASQTCFIFAELQ